MCETTGCLKPRKEKTVTQEFRYHVNETLRDVFQLDLSAWFQVGPVYLVTKSSSILNAESGHLPPKACI